VALNPRLRGLGATEDDLDKAPYWESPSAGAAPTIRGRLLDKVGDHPLQIGNLLSTQEQHELQSIAKLVKYPRPGMTIFTSETEAEYVYVIDEGIVRITRIAPNGERRILAFMVPGDLFGMPDCGIYVNTAETVSPTRLYRFHWPALRQLLTNQPQLQQKLLIKLAHDFRQAQRQMMMLGQQTARQRLAVFLLDFIRNPGFFNEQRSLLEIPVNRFDLADYLGTTRETAARAFSRLEKEGLIRRITAHTIQILNMEGLEQLQYGPARRTAIS
jgi:CRP-like cAMP-binding protein